MLRGIELPPNEVQRADGAWVTELTDADKIALDVIRPDFVQVRCADRLFLEAVHEVLPNAWLISRPLVEAYTAEEMIEWFWRFARAFARTGLLPYWLGHRISGEPNHPNGPYSWQGAYWYGYQLDQALDAIGTPIRPIISPGLTPYFNTPDWALMLDERRRRFGFRGVHVYWQDEHLADAIGDAQTQRGTSPANEVICTEFGEAPPEPPATLPPDAERAERCRSAVWIMAEAGYAGACQFILRAPGWEPFVYPAETFRSILHAAENVQPQQPKPVEVPVTNNLIGDGVRKAMAALGDSPANPDVDENWQLSLTVGKKYGYLYDKSGGGVVAFEKAQIPKA